VTSESRLRVLVADDQVVAARGTSWYLDALEMEVVAMVDDPRQIAAAFVLHRPDVVVFEIAMGQRGVAVAEMAALLTAEPACAVLVFTSDLSPLVVSQAMSCGCLGIVPKTSSMAAFGAAVRATAGGEQHLHPRAIAALLASRSTAQVDGTRQLSARELSILERIAEGSTNNEIAVELGISIDTVKTHVARILDKMRARDRTQAVSRALRSGLLR
jgi:DNA-binding NarL/FixJ family response regulator